MIKDILITLTCPHECLITDIFAIRQLFMACPFSGTGEELKCESQTSVIVQCPWQDTKITTYFRCPETTGGRCQTSNVGTHICGLGIRLIPADLRELCDRCFFSCPDLCRVIFCSSSSLERIGISCFEGTGVQEVSIPDSVLELCDQCFKGCRRLRRVIFGSSPSIKRIGASCFEGSGLEELIIPDSVRELCDRCFGGRNGLRCVIFGSSSSLERIGVKAFGVVKAASHGFASAALFNFRSRCGIVEISIPNSVRELGDGCFKECSPLRCVRFGASSSLERIGVACFMGTGIRVIIIPDSVRELCDRCFCRCGSLDSVVFGSSSSLQRIGVSCFEHTRILEFRIPDSVRELCDGCFKWCKYLGRVTFGSSPSLERIGDFCFARSGLDTLETPPSVKHLGDRLFDPIIVILIKGPRGSKLRLEVPLPYRIEEIKAKICDKEGVPPDSQQLVYGCDQLDDGKTLLDYGVTEDETTIILHGYWEHEV